MAQFVRQYAPPTLFMLLMLALVGGTVWAAWANYLRAGWDSNSAAWVQAAGAILAILGAAWLARGERRQTRRWRREQGEEAAWSTRFVIAQAQYDAHITAFELTQADVVLNEINLRTWRQRGTNSALFIQTMLSKVDHIHPLVVGNLCNAKILVDDMISDLALLAGKEALDKPERDKIISSIVEVHINLQELIKQYDTRIEGVQEALDDGDDMLP
jgi:hypothetical protein